MVFPTIPASALNRRFQIRSLRIATSGLPGLSSSGSSKRPSRGFAPSISSRLDCVRAPKNPLRPFPSRQHEGPALCQRHLFKGMILVLNINVLTWRRPVAQNSDCRRMQPHRSQPLRLRIRQRPQQQRIHDAEDRRVWRRSQSPMKRRSPHSSGSSYEAFAKRIEDLLEMFAFSLSSLRPLCLCATLR